ncbi:hypothetical protein VFPPC_09440 [Pochonia chlamydosporia 170]|uniref:Uncharacterized protein n=1 Tax=Pochonia chlamydosporia 170 TaxID=1380566 RepID=A0A179F875_METCM|nr:hypothetical protein VFPPC_09440 [Pochonia chlamydosporia 170]OAQ61626.1 hypothetical protein VFPPC_09440 [Pochonia chlamydosporia 170]
MPSQKPRGLQPVYEANAGTKYLSAGALHRHSDNEEACQQSVATCGSTGSTRHASPATTSTDDDLLGLPFAECLDAEDLQHLQAFLEELRGPKHLQKRDLSPQLDTDIFGNASTHQYSPEDAIYNTAHHEHTNTNPPQISNSTASNTAQPPSSPSSPFPIPTTNKHLIRSPSPGRTPLSADAINSMPQHTPRPASPVNPKPEVLYRQPQLFIGRLASSEVQHPPMDVAQFPTDRIRKRFRNRPDIRALPNYDEDPIE